MTVKRLTLRASSYGAVVAGLLISSDPSATPAAAIGTPRRSPVLPAGATRSPTQAGYIPGKYIPVAVPGYRNGTVADNVNELGDVAGWHSPHGLSTGYQRQAVGYAEIRGRYESIVDLQVPAGSSVRVQNVTAGGEVMAGYITPGSISSEFIELNRTYTTLRDPDADYTVRYGGTGGLGASMTGEVVGDYPDKTARHTWHGFVYLRGHWATVDCPAGHGYAGSALGYVSDFGRHMIAYCWTSGYGTVDEYIYSPDRTFSTSSANFALLPPPPGSQGYLYNFVNDLGVAGGDEFLPATDDCRSGVTDTFVYKNDRFTAIAPRAGFCDVEGNGVNDRGVLAVAELGSNGAVDSFLVTEGFQKRT